MYEDRNINIIKFDKFNKIIFIFFIDIYLINLNISYKKTYIIF